MKVGEVQNIVALFGKVSRHPHWTPLWYLFEATIFDNYPLIYPSFENFSLLAHVILRALKGYPASIALECYPQGNFQTITPLHILLWLWKWYSTYTTIANNHSTLHPPLKTSPWKSSKNTLKFSHAALLTPKHQRQWSSNLVTSIHPPISHPPAPKF